jgi:hypothetical protein
MPPRSPYGTALCLACGSETALAGVCAACSGTDLATFADGAVVALPAGHRPCDRCASADRPLVFRGSIRLYSVILLARESRVTGYVCEECARKQTAASLAFTGLLGWWGLISALVWAPRATYHNWRAVWRHPRKPLAWGALEADAFADAVRPRREDGWSTFGDEPEPAR